MKKLLYLNADDEVVGTLTINDAGKIIATGLGEQAAMLVVLEPGSSDTLLGPRDGDKWLEAVRHHYRTGYLRAVVEGEEGTSS